MVPSVQFKTEGRAKNWIKWVLKITRRAALAGAVKLVDPAGTVPSKNFFKLELKAAETVPSTTAPTNSTFDTFKATEYLSQSESWAANKELKF